MRSTLVCCVALLFGSGAVSVAQTPVIVELDYIAGARALKKKHFKKWYAGSNFNILVSSEKHGLFPVEDCPTLADLHDILASKKSIEEVPPGAWYSHGLMVAWGGFKGTVSGPCSTTITGMLLLLPDDSNDLGHREAFVVFDGMFVSQHHAKERTYTTAHEFGHVLNTGHCEYNLDDWHEFGNPLGTHIRQHLNRRYVEEDHVKPGGELWCSINRYHRREIQNPHCGIESKCCPEAPCGVYSEAGTGAVLEIEREQERYLPGEPIHVSLTLEADGMRDDLFYDEGSFNNMSGMLFFAVGDSPDSMEPLRMPILAEKEQKLLPLETGDSLDEKDIDLWFTLPPEWYGWKEGRRAAKTMWLRAAYVLYSPKERGSGEFRPVVIQSDPVEITIGVEPTLFHPEAHELFIDWQARRFVWLEGSHVLPEGRKKLELITENYPETIYAVYANLALGQKCDAPPFTRDRRRERADRCRTAWERLDSARSRLDVLSPAHQISPAHQKKLDEGLARIGREPR